MIKITENNGEQVEVKYPCLKKHDSGAIVLFINECSGTLLVKGDSIYSTHSVGDYRTDWLNNFYTVIDYPIVLENI